MRSWFSPTTRYNATDNSFQRIRDNANGAQEVRRSTQVHGCNFGEHTRCEE
jgi:hypothetical protein